MSSANPVHYDTFKLLHEKFIPSLNITVQEFEHNVTGAMHIHMQAQSEENVFLVALRTVPHDSTGVAHILEHTALCGSQKYPVRDPFFMMTRRSLNTFMNAFTSSDWTAYPVASLNKKDFDNLLDVYLDAVFFSRLDELDFAQEGHRLEFQSPSDVNSPLEFKGVVFNEMKGAMSSVSSQLWQTLTKYLFPTSTYHYNSGGEPEDIPNLSYDQLLDFYRTHYHPSNAIFMTYGDISAKEHQEKFEHQVMHAFTRLDDVISVTDEKRYYAPIRVQESYANDDDDLDKKTHVVMGWLLGQSINLKDTLRAQLLSSVLIDNSACPLMLALERSDLGNAPSPLCGLDDSQKELSFVCGLSGTEANASDATEALILDTLKSIVANGIPQAEIESALHQLELHQREVGGDSYPYGLQLILKSLTSANHRGDPATLLDLDAAIIGLHEEIKDPKFIPNLITHLLLDNPHCVRLTMTPDNTISKRKENAEKLRLEKRKASLSEEEKQNIITQSLALKERQESVDDPGALPKVTLADVPVKERSIAPEYSEYNGTKISSYTTGTNGLVYQQAIYTLPQLSGEELSHLSLYNTCLTELGAGAHSYIEMQQRQSAVSGGVSTFSSMRGGVNNPNEGNSFLVYSGKSLQRNHAALSDLIADILNGARFDEHPRMRELISQVRVGMEQGITGSGHMLAMTAAASSISIPAQMSHKYSGLEAIKSIKIFDELVSTADGMDSFASTLAQLHKKIIAQSSELLVIGEASAIQSASAHYAALCQPATLDSSFKYNFTPQQHNTREAWIANSQVNFCAKAYPTVSMGHEDSAALVILGSFLRNGFLHKNIREQGGAYGGGASQDNNGGSFRFYSYRDPRISDTLNDFDSAIEWLKSTKHHPSQLEEAILGTIGSIDRSESPAGQAKRCFYSDMHARTLDVREAYRKRILNTNMDDLVRVAETYIKTENAHTVVVTGKHGLEEARALELDIIEL